MDDTWKRYLSSFLLTLALLSSLTGHADSAELEFISQEQTTALAQTFEGASLSPEQLLQRNSKWSCDMYGMRTRLQVQRGVKLYEWSAHDKTWTNSGAQPVANYQLENGTLTGKTPRLEDQVRATREGKLISRLSASGDAPRVLAYSVCTAL
ncbi:MAG: hypothetical protein KF799_02755 [Bdellovibrionales bacterium]|nr:hypothetical protein [Bdellovibrionales bacterium]